MSQIAVYSQSSGPGSGTVTSVTGGTGITITGNPAVNPTVNLTVPVVIANGGTNATSFTNIDGVVYYDGTRLVTTNTGTNGQVLTISGGIPSFQNNVAGSVTITGDVGGPITSNTFTLTGGTSGAVFTGSGTTFTESFNYLALPASAVSPDAGYISIGGNKFMHSLGSFNTFLGEIAGNYSLNTGSALANTGIGYRSLRFIDTGQNNTAVGSGTMFATTTGSLNTGVGSASLASLTIGNDNTAIGVSSLGAVTSSSYNTGLGYASLVSLATGLGLNTAVGYATANNLVSGSSNIFMGNGSGSSYTTSESSNIIIMNTGTIADANTTRIGTQGSGAGQQNKAFMAGIVGVTVSNPTTVVINSATGQLGVAAGGGSPIETLTADSGGALTPTAGNMNILGGHDMNTAGAGSTITVALNNAITLGDLSDISGTSALTLTTGDQHITAGLLYLANSNGATITGGGILMGGNNFVTNYGTGNTFVGGGSGNPILTVGSATNNTAVGRLAMDALTTGSQNTSIGSSSLGACTTGLGNAAMGFQSLQILTTGQHNVGIGVDALSSITTGGNNTAVGYQSLSSIDAGTNSNTALGYQTGLNLDTGQNNIFIGLSAGSTLATSESSNILIGNSGTLADGNTIRIGTQGSSLGQQNLCFIAGIIGVTTSSSNMVTINASTGQLGVASVPVTAVAWSVITADQSAAVNNGYICNKAGLLTLTLPTTAAVGSIIRVTGINTALGWKIAQSAGQTIYFGNQNTTTGATGSLASSATRDTVEIVCVVANNDFNVLSSIGNITVV